MTTTYIFGAGASAGSDFKLPCMRGFFNNDLRSGHYMALQTFIDRYFSDVPLDELNLEEVITALDLASDSFGKFGQIIDRYIYGARLDFESYVLNRLEYKPLESRYYCKKHLEILKRINKGDSLVTLNYDLVLEN